MYVCSTHGELSNEWCDDCQECKPCDHREITTTRIKDFIYDSDQGERTVTITLTHCQLCGDPESVDL